MKRSFMMFAIVAGGLMALIFTWSLLVAPATSRRDAAIDQATGVLFREIDVRIPRLASRTDVKTLELIRKSATQRVKESRRLLLTQDREQDAWFSQLVDLGPNDTPNRDEFQQTYAFARDQLRRDIRSALERVPESRLLTRFVTTIPIYVADFEKDDRLPKNTELRPVQRIFNIQRLVLLSAAKAGALPIAAPKVTFNWARPRGTRSRFVEEKVVVRLLLPSRRLPVVLRALVGLGGAGPVCRLAGLTTRPRTLPIKLAAEEVPPIEIEVSLILTVYEARKT